MAMIHRSLVRAAVGVAVFLLCAAVPAVSQPQGRGQGAPRYDPATETTVTGTVESVERIAGPGGGRGRGGLGGTHVTLRTGTETIDVHLGPTAFLQELNVAVDKGDTLDIVGSRITLDGEPVFIAKSVKKGDTLWTLRDAAGRPLGRGGR